MECSGPGLVSWELGGATVGMTAAGWGSEEEAAEARGPALGLVPKALHECAAKGTDQQCPQGPGDGTSGHGHRAHHKPGTARTQTLSPFQAQRGQGSQNALGWEGQNQQAR